MTTTITKTQTLDDRERMTVSATPRYVPTHKTIRRVAATKNQKVTTVANECMTAGAKVFGYIQ